jgi:murein DD-endopeptidase MepM/ murein hydrolase activator NlpD
MDDRPHGPGTRAGAMPFLAPIGTGRMATKSRTMYVVMAGALALSAVLLISVDLGPHEVYAEEPAAEEELVDLPPPTVFGVPVDGRTVEELRVPQGATFGAMLGQRGVPMTTVHQLVELAAGTFDVRRIRAGHPCAFIREAADGTPTHFIYEVDPVDYVVFTLGDSLAVHAGQRPVTVDEGTLSCAVTGALYNDIARAGGDPALAVALSEVFAWTVDFHRIQKNDTFTVVFAQRRVDGRPVGVPKVRAARYTSGGQVKEAFLFGEGTEAQYYDAEGHSLRKAFLKAPLKYSRISSGYSAKRLHPVQKVMKAHLGTDYAAPYGTPILAVGDGVVEQAAQTGGNGKFVKIRHNGVYSTQYLHMQRILVKQGQRVRQGDVIGEVGSTGLATGPHVCFRFWKNGKQVDHRREEFPSAEPVPTAQRATFDGLRAELAARLDDALAQQRATRHIVF